MAEYNILAVFSGKAAQYVDLSTHTLKLGDLKLGTVLLSDSSTATNSGSDKVGVTKKNYPNIGLDYSTSGGTVQGLLDGIEAAIATAGSSDFTDSTFRIQDDGDASKEIAFQASGITTSTVRTITMPDADVDLGDIATNNAKVSADGSVTSHSDVTSAGSGIIISAGERTAIGDSTTFNTDLGLTTNGKGASKVAIEDAAAQFTSTNVEGALTESLDAAQAAQATADAAMPTADLASTANGDGASLIGIEDAAADYTATTVEGALAEVKVIADDAIPATEKGAVNGVASLDGGGKIPTSQLPNSIMEFQGNWNANTNSPTLADGTGNAGDVYRISVAGSQDLGSGSVSYGVGDWVMYNGTIWEKGDNTDEVTSVHGRTGVVVSANGDYTASEVTNVPAGGIAAVTVQAAIDELDSEKYNAADFNSDWDTRLGTKSTTDLSEGTNLYYTSTRAEDDTIVESFTVATGGVTAGDIVYVNGSGEVAPALASAIATSKGVIGVALTTESAAATVRVATAGKVTVTVSAEGAFGVGDKVFLSKATAGRCTTLDTGTEAVGSGDVVLPLGVANSSTTILWNLGEPVEIQ